MTSSPKVAQRAMEVLSDLRQIEAALSRIQTWAEQLTEELEAGPSDDDIHSGKEEES